MTTHVFEAPGGGRIERWYSMAQRIPKTLRYEGTTFTRIFVPPQIGVVRGAGRRGKDFHFVSDSLPRDIKNASGVYPSVDEKGRPRFNSREEVERSTAELNRRGLAVKYGEDCWDDLAADQKPPEGPVLRTKMGFMEEANGPEPEHPEAG